MRSMFRSVRMVSGAMQFTRMPKGPACHVAGNVGDGATALLDLTNNCEESVGVSTMYNDLCALARKSPGDGGTDSS